MEEEVSSKVEQQEKMPQYLDRCEGRGFGVTIEKCVAMFLC